MVQLSDIDRSHRVGNPNTPRSKPRDIIVKFATYRSRQNFYKQRTRLKDTGHPREFVNEDLTKFRSGILYEARNLSKVEFIKGAWTSDGNILVKDKDDTIHRINGTGDLFHFGYLVMSPGLPSRSGLYRVPYRSGPMRQRGAVHTRDRRFAVAVGSTSSGVGDMDHSGTDAKY